MVGVAGRSKGCVTCRKRKKGVSGNFDITNSLLALAILTASSATQDTLPVANAQNETSYVEATIWIASSSIANMSIHHLSWQQGRRQCYFGIQ